MNCPKCDGLLVRDLGYELEINAKPAYRCVNCGKYIDRRIIINQGVTLAEQAAFKEKPKATPRFTRSLAVLAGRVAYEG